MCPLKGGLSDPPPAKKIIELVPKRGVNDDRKKEKLERAYHGDR